MHFTTLTTCLALGTTGWAAYTLEDDYFSGGDFFSQFSFWGPDNGGDPTNGFVNYDRHENLLESSASNAKMWISNATSAPNGRDSIRITSNKSYSKGLIVLDVESMPGGVCGQWPAFWTVGPNWPNQGEIDIIEGVNVDTTNKMTLHTGPGCSISSGGGSSTTNNKATAMTGTVEATDCDCTSGSNEGCGITTNDQQSYGVGLNEGGGGVYATEWTTSGISVYFFPRSSVPSDINNGKPDPSSWGSPVAHFSGGCDISKTFTDHQIVFDTTFCGDWAGADDVWSQSCAASTGKSCQDYVAQNGEDFEGQHWSVNSLKVYQNDGSSSEPEPSAAPSASAPAPTVSAPASVPASTYAPAPTESAAPSSWAPIESSTPAASPSGGWNPTTSAVAAPSSPAESQPWSPPASHTWGGGNPWESGSPWGQQRESDDGGWDVGTAAMRRRHARHLAHHKAHAPGRL